MYETEQESKSLELVQMPTIHIGRNSKQVWDRKRLSWGSGSILQV